MDAFVPPGAEARCPKALATRQAPLGVAVGGVGLVRSKSPDTRRARVAPRDEADGGALLPRSYAWDHDASLAHLASAHPPFTPTQPSARHALPKEASMTGP